MELELGLGRGGVVAGIEIRIVGVGAREADL